MKTLIALILFASCNATAQTNPCNQKKYSIEIFDQDYSMAYTTQYHVFDDSLIIRSMGGIEGERDSCLLKRKISKSESSKVYNVLHSLDTKNLKDIYEDPLVSDGDRKIITFCFENKTKTIKINNFYQPDIANLFEVINQINGTEFKIRYKPRAKYF